MAKLVIVVSTTDSIADLNSKIHAPTKPHTAVNNIQNYMNAILAGAVDASMIVTTRDTSPSVTTSGSGSEQETYDLS